MVGLEEHGVVVTGRKRGRMPIGKANPGGTLRPALTARAVTRRDRHRIGGLADRDRELLPAEEPTHGRPVGAVHEHNLEEAQAARHEDRPPRVVLHHHAPGHGRPRGHRVRRQYHPRRGAASCRWRCRVHACRWARGSTGIPCRDVAAAGTPCHRKRQHDEECPHINMTMPDRARFQRHRALGASHHGHTARPANSVLTTNGAQQARFPGTADDTPRALQASTSFVLALPHCGRCTLTPTAAPALTGTQPGKPGHRTRRPGRCKRLGRVKDHPRPPRQGSSGAMQALLPRPGPRRDIIGTVQRQVMPKNRRHKALKVTASLRRSGVPEPDIRYALRRWSAPCVFGDPRGAGLRVLLWPRASRWPVGRWSWPRL
jgi:hypothetical protein